MIAVAEKTKMYSLRFRGQRELISQRALAKLNDSLGARYKFSTPEVRKKILTVFIELNTGYLKKPPTVFRDQMDAEDWFAVFKMMMPHALMNYEPSLGHLMSYILGWKHASFNKWQDDRGGIYRPRCQRILLSQIEKKIRLGLNMSEEEKRRNGLLISGKDQEFYDSATIQIISLNSPTSQGDTELLDTLTGEDPRDSAGSRTDCDIWEVVKRQLSPDEFQIWYWKYHPDYELTNEEIGRRIGVTYERVRQKLNKIRLLLQKRMAVHGYGQKGI